MKYTFETKFNKGEIVYTILPAHFSSSIFRLIVIGFEINKPAFKKDAIIRYLCVPCDKYGNPTGEEICYDEKSKLFWEDDLYSSLEDIISEDNINRHQEAYDVKEDYDDMLEGEDILPIVFNNTEKE